MVRPTTSFNYSPVCVCVCVIYTDILIITLCWWNHKLFQTRLLRFVQPNTCMNHQLKQHSNFYVAVVYFQFCYLFCDSSSTDDPGLIPWQLSIDWSMFRKPCKPFLTDKFKTEEIDIKIFFQGLKIW